MADGPLVAISVVMPIATRWRQVEVASAASALGIQLEMETKGLLVWIGSVEVEVRRGCGSSELEGRDGSIEARRAANISCGTISGAVMAARAVSTSTTASLRRTFDWLTGPTAGMRDMRDEGEAPTGSGGDAADGGAVGDESSLLARTRAGRTFELGEAEAAEVMEGYTNCLWA